MLTLTALLLAAGPVHLVALHGPETQAALAPLKAARGTVVDGSALHGYLLRPAGPLPMQDFDGFSAPPHPGWPQALADEWTRGVAGCRDIAGPAPWKKSLPAASTCANRLSLALWQRFAAHHQATLVLEVDARVNDKKGVATVKGLAWDPAGAEQRTQLEQPSAGDVSAAVTRVVKSLLDGEGQRAPRAIAQAPGAPTASAADPFAGAAAVSSPITLTKTCAAQQVMVRLATRGPVAESVEARWPKPTRRGAALECSLSFAEHEEDLGPPMPPMTVVTATMTCARHRAVAEVAKLPMKGTPVGLLSEKLVQGLAAKLCE